MMWHDQLVRRGDPRWKGFESNGSDATVKLLDVMGKDVIVCDWCYNDPPKDGRFPTMDHFREKGFEVMTCPWFNVNGIVAQCDYARRYHLGVIGTTWHRFVSLDMARGVAHVAAGAWSKSAMADMRHNDTLGGSAYAMLRFTIATHWRQVGWETPGTDDYPETGFFTDQISTSIREL